MSMAKEKKDKSAKEKNDKLAKMIPILAVLVVVSVAAGAYFVLFMPKMAELSATGGAALSALEVQVVSDEAYEKQLDAALERFGLLNTQLRQKTQTIIPLELDAPGIFVQLDGVARKHNFVITAVSITEIEDEIGPQSQQLVKVTLNIEGGDYQQFIVYLADLERSVRLLDVESVVFTPLSAQYSLTLRTYYLDPGAAEEGADAVPVQ